MRKDPSPIRFLSLSISSGILPWVIMPLAFLAGGLSGHLLAGVDTQGFAGVLENYRDAVLTQPTEPDPLGVLLWMTRSLLLGLILSCSTLGAAGLPLLVGVHGFAAGYALSALYRCWGYQGLWTAMLCVAVPRGILLALLLAIAIPGWQRSILLLTRGPAERPSVQDGWSSLCFCFGGMALAVLYETMICHLAPRLF